MLNDDGVEEEARLHNSTYFILPVIKQFAPKKKQSAASPTHLQAKPEIRGSLYDYYFLCALRDSSGYWTLVLLFIILSATIKETIMDK